MFCPNCGKENPAENRFCMECGTELIDNQSGSVNASDVAAAAIHSSKKLATKAVGGMKRYWKVLIPVAAVIVLVCVFAVIGSRVCDPQRVAEKYFNGMINADADKAYSCMSIEESQFTDKASFDAYWREIYAPKDVYNYTVREVSYGIDTNESRLEREYAFEYYLSGESNVYTEYVTVVNSGKKRLLFFDEYQVMPDFIVRDYTICTYHGMNVTFAGVPLEVTEEDSTYDYYRIPMLFRRTYDIVLENDMINTAFFTVYPFDNYEEYNCFDLEYSDAIREELYELASSQVSDILHAAIAHSGFPTNISADGDSVYESYSNLESRLYDPEDQRGYTSIVLTDVYDDSDTYQYYTPDMSYVCDINFDYDYSYNSVYWWTHEIETETGESYGWATMEYYYSESEGWVLTDIYIRY